MSAFTPGLRLHDRFTLTGRVGLGGMSEVWRADDGVLGRTVAVKVLSSPMAADPALRAATWREARAAARLTHPNVTQVYDYGEAAVSGGAAVPYLVMEFVEGQSLAERLAGAPLPGPEVATIGAQVASALAAAHRLGIVHRDVKPGNIMLTPTGAKVLDFGIAALAGAGDTDAGLLVGTPAYAAPERLRPGPAQPASDVYALGVVLCEMATGRPPIAARSWADAERAHRMGVRVPPLDLPGLPPRVSQLARACLSADPGARPSAEQVATALASTSGTNPTAALPADATARLVPAGYAVGSASLPHPPTMVERAPLGSVPIGEERRPGRSRLLLVGLLGAAAAVGLTAILVAAALRSSGTGGEVLADPTTSGPPASSSAASPSPASDTSSPAAPQSRDEIVAALGQQIDIAVAAGSLEPDAADQLRDRLSELQKGNPRKRATDLAKKIDDLRDDGKISQSVADQLLLLLRPLTGDRGQDHGD
jgi:eukaryotic-like serine/threonine-protein kinase